MFVFIYLEIFIDVYFVLGSYWIYFEYVMMKKGDGFCFYWFYSLVGKGDINKDL